MEAPKTLVPKRFAKDLKEGLLPIVDLVYPPRCPSCGAATATHGALCMDCWGELEFPKLDKSGADHSAKDIGRHSEIIAATIYNDMSKKLVLMLKRGGKLALAPLLGRMIASRIHNEEEQSPFLIPVPLHRTRIWQRGFNQAALLAREVAKAGKGELLVDGLVRTKRTPSLAELSYEERAETMNGAIAVRPKAERMIKDRAIILIDDVLTSGATSTACVEALLDAGASDVRIACFARTRGSTL